MLNLFFLFLSHIIHNLIEYTSTDEIKDKENFQAIFEVYILLRRIADNFERFGQVLPLWQQSEYYGGHWSKCQNYISLANHALHLLDQDFADIIFPQTFKDGRYATTFEESERLYFIFYGGPPLPKFKVFDIWKNLIKINATENFCGWIRNKRRPQWQKTIFIPNYSLLLPSVQRTSELTDLKQSYWQYNVDFDYLQRRFPTYDGLDYLPELPPKFPIESQERTLLERPEYAVIVVVPQQDQVVSEIIKTIQKDTATFRVTISNLRQVLITQAKHHPESFFKVLS